MAWRRKRSADDVASVDATQSDAGADGAVADHVLADDVVLDELSRAFADDGGADDGGADDGGDDDDDGDRHDDGDAVDGDAVDATVAPPASGARGTISIVADDLPDAAYLDDELERHPTGTRPVFIDDDGSSDAVMPKDASTRGIEPRIRQRRIGVKRAENRRRLWWLALAAVVVIVVVAVLAVLGSSLFAVDEVTVTGNVYTDQVALDAIVDDLIGTPVLLVDTDEVEAQVETIAWVEDARVRTSFPDAASIEIRERTPVAAMMGADGRARVFDVDGRVLSLVDGQPVALVWISGPGTLDLAVGEFAPIGYSSAASVVTKLPPDIRSRVDSMLVTPDGADLVMVLTSEFGPVEVRFGSAIGENAQIEKLVRLQRTLEDVGTKPVTVIDVSTSEVTVR